MQNIKLLIGAVSILSISAFTAFQSINWKLKDDYSVKWDHSAFKGLKATILFDEVHPEKSKITAFIDARTVNTGNSLMDAHAREKDALYTAKYPEITFVSRLIKKTGAGRYEAIGDLTLKGITREIKLPFAFDSKKDIVDRFPPVMKETFYGHFTIAPKDFNITREGAPEQVTLELVIPVTK